MQTLETPWRRRYEGVRVKCVVFATPLVRSLTEQNTADTLFPFRSDLDRVGLIRGDP